MQGQLSIAYVFHGMIAECTALAQGAVTSHVTFLLPWSWLLRAGDSVFVADVEGIQTKALAHSAIAGVH